MPEDNRFRDYKGRTHVSARINMYRRADTQIRPYNFCCVFHYSFYRC